MLLSIIIIIARNLQDTIKAQYVTGGRERTLETRLLRFLQINSTYKVLVKQHCETNKAIFSQENTWMTKIDKEGTCGTY